MVVWVGGLALFSDKKCVASLTCQSCAPPSLYKWAPGLLQTFVKFGEKGTRVGPGSFIIIPQCCTLACSHTMVLLYVESGDKKSASFVMATGRYEGGI